LMLLAHRLSLHLVQKLPERKILIPGVVENPELVADPASGLRAACWTRERHCRPTAGSEPHPQLAWAKVAALTEVAQVASQKLST
jgi:hypothetical protein